MGHHLLAVGLLVVLYFFAVVDALEKDEEKCRQFGVRCRPSGEEETYVKLLALTRRGEQEATWGPSCPAGAVTAHGHTDGFGAQYSAMIGVYLSSFEKDVAFCHTPWHYGSHLGYGQYDHMGSLFEFVGGHFLGPEATPNTTKVPHIQVLDGRAPRIPEAMYRVRAAYFAVPKPALRFYQSRREEINTVNLAFHLRRGDVSPEKHSNRYDSDEDVINCLRNLVDFFLSSHNKLQQRRLDVHVFSEGHEDDFANVTNAFPTTTETTTAETNDEGYDEEERADAKDDDRLRVFLHLNDGIAETFHHFVNADALVVSQSSFSKTAARLNLGRIYSLRDSDVDYRIRSCASPLPDK
mmetsp:Transcript_4883/g.15998  ORF Transcript_4883/g.15998 Transcript_4883/m.15998 type:complete len:352 (-) Transcript_4883:1328-2383(-)